MLMDVQGCEESGFGICKTSKSTLEEERKEGLMEDKGKGVCADSVREVENRLAQSQELMNSYSQCLQDMKEMLESVLWRHQHCSSTEHDSNKDEGTVEVGLRQCLQHVCEYQRLLVEEGGVECMIGDTISAQTVSFLRSELDSCRKDLCTDKQVFAEKMVEMEELQMTCCLLSHDKEQAEAMWQAAQASETSLLNQLEHLSQKVAILESVGVVGEEEMGVVGEEEMGVVSEKPVGVICEEPEGVVGGESVNLSREELDVNGGSVYEDSLDEEGPGGGSKVYSRSSSEVRSLKLQKFTAYQSLLRGKVRTSHLEVSTVGHLQYTYIL